MSWRTGVGLRWLFWAVAIASGCKCGGPAKAPVEIPQPVPLAAAQGDFQPLACDRESCTDALGHRYLCKLGDHATGRGVGMARTCVPDGCTEGCEPRTVLSGEVVRGDDDAHGERVHYDDGHAHGGGNAHRFGHSQ